MKVAIGSDHAGVALKAEIIKFLEELSYEVIDFGPHSTESVDYPDYAGKVAQYIQKHDADKGVLICGTGIGISISANKYRGIRCALCSDSYTARITREHNNSNIVAMGARIIGEDLAKEIVREFLGATYEGGRHQNRLDKITLIEEQEAQ